MMLSFKRFLNESALNILEPWKVEPLDDTKALELLRKNCSASLSRLRVRKVLWKGVTDEVMEGASLALVDSTNMVRRSVSTNNLYQLMMDNSVYLKDIPSRTNSVICSTNLSMARAYGRAYAVIPFNDEKIVIANSGDFIFKEVNIHGLIKPVSSISGALGSVLKQHWDNMSVSNINDFLSGLSPEEIIATMAKSNRAWFKIDGTHGPEDINTLVEFIKTNPIQPKFLDDLLNNLRKDKSFQAFADMLTPENLDLKIVKAGRAIAGKTECWFSGKCIMIHEDIIDDIISQLKNES